MSTERVRPIMFSTLKKWVRGNSKANRTPTRRRCSLGVEEFEARDNMSVLSPVAVAHDVYGRVEAFAINSSGALYEQNERSGGGYSPGSWYHIANSIKTVTVG